MVRLIGETHPCRSHAICTGDTAQIMAIQFNDMNGHWAYSLRRTGTIWSPLDSYDLYYDDELELVEREVESFYE